MRLGHCATVLAQLLPVLASEFCGGAKLDGCLAEIGERYSFKRGTLSALNGFIETCGDGNSLLDLLRAPKRLPQGSIRRHLERHAAASGQGGEEPFVVAAIAALRRHAEAVFRQAVEFAHACFVRAQCTPRGEVVAQLQRVHAEGAAGLGAVAALANSTGRAARLLPFLGTAAQVLARSAGGLGHLEVALRLIRRMRDDESQLIFDELHDMAYKTASVSCEVRAQLFAQFQLVDVGLPLPSVKRGRSVPRLRFHGDMGPRRQQILVNLLHKLQQREPSRRLHAVEVGVNTAVTSEYLLKEVEGLSMVCVDPYLAGDDDEGFHSIATRRLRPFGGRAQLWRKKSVHAASRVGPRSLDLVFVDGDHSRDAVLEDLHAWRSKVRPGGILAGHDLFNILQEGVVGGAFEHVASMRVNASAGAPAATIHFALDYVWWLYL